MTQTIYEWIEPDTCLIKNGQGNLSQTIYIRQYRIKDLIEDIQADDLWYENKRIIYLMELFTKENFGICLWNIFDEKDHISWENQYHKTLEEAQKAVEMFIYC